MEIGIDAPDFPTALRAAVRQAPDVIVVGEMRDPETMRIALAAARDGHLVLTTMHTTDVASTVGADRGHLPARAAADHPPGAGDGAGGGARPRRCCRAVGGGRIPAAELLMVGYGARQHIRKNALQHLNQEITITRKPGSFTLEDCLVALVKRGLVEKSDAVLRAAHPEEFEKALAQAERT